MDNKEKIRFAINQIAINNCDGSANEESIKAIRYLQEVSEALTIPDVSVSFPSKECDEACYYYCTKGGQQPPECINEH